MNRDLKEWQSDLNFNEHMDSIYYEIKLCVKELHQKFKELYENNDFYVFDRSCFNNLISEMIYEDWRVKVLVDECHKQKMFDSNIISFFMKNNDFPSIIGNLSKAMRMFGSVFKAHDEYLQSARADARSAIGKSGGIAKAKAFDSYKAIVLNEWNTRKHRTYEECANFLISQNKVDVAHRTITKWIADFEKENRGFRTLG
ncbi:hypothetical protein F900_03430 [Acinetobacter modestus]|uniref:Uncharacterized protein n=1 Tax=Acinetobacter modestus TaxID=1776740 RepID=N9LP00_9GAMM|nr:hypothetical protein [Acinetobacter modestus]ENW97963.1 hypothetical protein F900_03430 [Acinetobacter modestus]